MRVGFGNVDITPALEPGLRLAGNRPWPRPSGVRWPLRGRVMLADDGERRLAIVCLDLLALPAAEVTRLRAQLAAVGVLPPEAILVACSHTHRAPFTYPAGEVAEEEVFGAARPRRAGLHPPPHRPRRHLQRWAPTLERACRPGAARHVGVAAAGRRA